jgi:hypothetical protein
MIRRHVTHTFSSCQSVNPITLHMNSVPSTVAVNVHPVARLGVWASGRISDVARWRRNPAKRPRYAPRVASGMVRRVVMVAPAMGARAFRVRRVRARWRALP